MPKNSDITLAQEQIKIKPQIEEIIPELLDGELKTTALEFAAYLRAKKLTPQYSSVNSWKISYKGKCVCYIKMSSKMEKNIWRVVFYLDKYNREFSEGFKKAVQDNLQPCEACLKACRKGIGLTVFGKEFPNRCCHFPIQFVNPKGNILEYVKELIEYRKSVINTNNFHNYWWLDNTIV